MLKLAFDEGAKCALDAFGVKDAGWLGTAGKWVADTGKSVGRSLVGQPITGAKQIWRGAAFDPPTATRPGGVLHDALWPTIDPNASKWGKGYGWLQRGLTLGLPAYDMIQAARGQGDPNEGRLSNMLGAAGSGAGFALGMPLAGMLGAPLIANAGRHLGNSLGHLLGSRPTPQPPPQFDPSMYANYPAF